MTTQSFLRRSFALLLWVLLASRAPAAVTELSAVDWPLHFEPNHGQTREDVKFLSRGPGYGVYLTANEAVLALSAHGAQSCTADDATVERERVVRMTLLGGAKTPAVHAVDEQKGKANYFVGTDSSKWRTNIPTYAKVRYDAVYPGIDLVYYGTQRQLEYDFVLAPGADPRDIDLKFDGADRVEIDAKGDLVLHACGRDIRQPKPTVYQEANGRREVAGRYVRKGKNRIGFALAAYDRSLPLIIDPLVLSYATYLGYSPPALDIAVDVHGSAYVTYGRQVLKFDSSGSLVYSTSVGALHDDRAIAVDREGNAYISGVAGYSFPTTPGAFQQASSVGPSSYAVAKLDPTGSTLVYATVLGGQVQNPSDPRDRPGRGAIAVDASGSAYVTGVTDFPDFPKTSAAFQQGQGWAFVTKLNAAGSDVIYSSVFAQAEPRAIAIGGDGTAYVTGSTGAATFPVTTGAFQTALLGTRDAFVTRFSPAGALVYSTYLGGQLGETGPYPREEGRGIAVDAAGNAYVAGWSNTSDFPTTPRAYRTAAVFGHTTADDFGFVTKLDPGGSELIYSTRLVGICCEIHGASPGDITVDASGRAYVAGGSDDFVTIVEPSGSWVNVSGISAGTGEFHSLSGIARNAAANTDLWVVGATDSDDFPTTPNAYQTQHVARNRSDFVAKFTAGPRFIPGTLQAESFDRGGEGVGFHDNTPGNQGDAGFRIGEDVDVFVSNDASGGTPYIVKNFEAGEWLAYTIHVPTAGNYDITLRASTHPNFPNPTYHVEIDDADVTGTVVLPNTGGWDNYQWLGKRTIALASGTHVLKVVAEQAYFDLSAIKVDATIVSAPYFRAPNAVPGVIEAEAFDAGGEGIAYHDNAPGNQGDTGYRSGEDVDTFVSHDTGSGSWYTVKNFDAGEWLAYTINVPTGGDYDVEVRAATDPAFPNAAYHIEIDGTNVTSSVPLENTGGWESYQWIGKKTVSLPAGVHVLKLVSDQPYFDLNAFKITPTTAPRSRTYFGAPIAVPGVFEAESFDAGEGFGYHDNAPGNQGDSGFRDGDSVDVFVTNDAASGSPYIVKNFEAGEWLGYTIDVTAGGNYDVELRASTQAEFANSAYHIEVDGVNATGTVLLPDTGGWDNYQWLGLRTIGLAPGVHVLTVVVDQPYFNLNSLRVLPSPP